MWIQTLDEMTFHLGVNLDCFNGSMLVQLHSVAPIKPDDSFIVMQQKFSKMQAALIDLRAHGESEDTPITSVQGMLAYNAQNQVVSMMNMR